MHSIAHSKTMACLSNCLGCSVQHIVLMQGHDALEIYPAHAARTGTHAVMPLHNSRDGHVPALPCPLPVNYKMRHNL
jgi:hypothetical protein